MPEWTTTEDISREVWRRVLEFANADYANARISAQHGPPTDQATKKNYQKQAEQIRVSVLQGKEYFDAAGAATLFTGPNHLYYGMMSLASAIMLLRGTGDQALDRLRQDTRKKSHGLHFSTAITKETSSHGMSLLADTRIEVANQGFFETWCRTLPPECRVHAVREIRKNGLISQNREGVGHERVIPADEMVGKKTSILQLFGRLPDMCQSPRRYEYVVPASRVSFTVIVDYDLHKTMWRWQIHGAPHAAALESILQRFKSPYRLSECWVYREIQGHTGCVVEFKVSFKEERGVGFRVEWPSTRETLNAEAILYSELLDTHEIVDAYRAGFALSMLSRYYPDLWIRCIDSHCMAAQAIEQFVFVMCLKFPSMVLNHLMGEDVTISSLRPPWY